MSIPDIIQCHEMLEQAKDSIAREVYSLVNKVIGQKLPEAAQLQHLITIAGETDSFEEVSIFIEYQGARAKIKIAEELLHSIQKLRAIGENEQLFMQKVRLFFGYLHQYMRHVKLVEKDIAGEGRELGIRLARRDSRKALENIGQIAKRAQSATEFLESIDTLPDEDKSSISPLIDAIRSLIKRTANPQMWHINRLLHSAGEEIKKSQQPKTKRGR